MKKNYIYFLALIMILFTYNSCKKSDNTPATTNNTNNNNNNNNVQTPITDTYYWQAEVNGKWVTFQTNSPGYAAGSTDEDCVLNYPNFAVDIQFGGSGPTDAAIKALATTTFTYNQSNPYYADIEYSINDSVYDCNTTQTSATFKVTSVTASGTYLGWNAYTIKGTCTCTLKNEESSATKTVTSGAFTILMAASS